VGCTNAGSDAERVALEPVLVVVCEVELVVVLCVEALLVVVVGVCNDEGGALDTDTVLVPEPQPPSSAPPVAPRTTVVANSTPRLIVSGYSPLAMGLLAGGPGRLPRWAPIRWWVGHWS
jgi:hypothetical protein